MRVLHVIDGIDVGGAEYVLVQLVEGLQAAGVKNYILVMTSCGPLKERLLASGAELIEIGAPRKRVPLRALYRMVREVRAAAPDVIQGWIYHGNLAATVLRILARSPAPVVWSNHNTLDPPVQLPAISRAAAKLNRYLSGWPEGIIYVSEVAEKQHERAGFNASKALVIPNGTDCVHFRPRPNSREMLSNEIGNTADVTLFGLFARWHPMKGHAVLFSAAAKLRASGVPFHIVLAGTGIERQNPELVDALAREGIDDHVSCLGERYDIHALLPGLDAFVLPSVFGEAFPLVLGEAMASEVPCIATDVGDSRLIVGDTGAIIPPGDPEALADAMRAVVEMPAAERMARGRLARKRIEEGNSLEAMVGRYIELYERVRLNAPSQKRHALGLGD